MTPEWLNIGATIGNTLDALFTSDEERQQLGNELARIEADVNQQLTDLVRQNLALQGQLIEAQARTITAEASGDSWLQRSWRPITMLTFLVLIVLDAFGVLAFRLSEQAWSLLEIGLGGYVVGRSLEKIVPGTARSVTQLGTHLRNFMGARNGHSG
jgi:hypothetical protein